MIKNPVTPHPITLPINQDDSEVVKMKKFIYTWAHDYGNHLANMEVLIDEMESNDPEQNDFIEMAKITCKQMREISDNIRTFTITGQELHLEECSVDDIVDPIIKTYKVMALKGIMIVLTNTTAREKIVTDKVKLTQILTNLITNAIKFSPPDSIVHVNIYDADNEIVFEVIDSGIGIPQAKLSQIFLPFIKLNKEYRGTGLGLTNCKRFVEELKGTISVMSIPNYRTTFQFVLPMECLTCE